MRREHAALWVGLFVVITLFFQNCTIMSAPDDPVSSETSASTATTTAAK